MKKMLKDALILIIITVVAGAALGFVFYITKEPIAIMEEQTRQEAYREVYPEASDFQAVDLNTLSKASDWEEKGFANVNIDECLLAKDGAGEVTGYVITVTTKEGYGGDIKYTVGIEKGGTLKGISILAISETAGLGMNAESVLVPQFIDKNVAEFTVTKTGSTSDSEIDAISGATITSKAVVKGVNAALYFYQNTLGGGTYEG